MTSYIENSSSKEYVTPDLRKVDPNARAYATGKRKNAIARVWIKAGSGKIIVNDQEFRAYFTGPVLQMIIQQPLIAAALHGRLDIVATVVGGGLNGQAGAIRHGISKALTYMDPGLRSMLKKGGFLTGHSQAVERTKYRKMMGRRSSLVSNSFRSHGNAALALEPAEHQKAASRYMLIAELDDNALAKEVSSWGNLNKRMDKLASFTDEILSKSEN